MKRLWILRLVPPLKLGRYLIAAILLSFIYMWLELSEVQGAGAFSFAIGLYFCVTAAYVVPIFHFTVERTEEALDELAPHLSIDADTLAATRANIGSKSRIWVLGNLAVAVSMWLLQSWLLSGSSTRMFDMVTSDFVQFSAATVPLVVWLITTCAVHGLVDNARLFRRLTKDVEVDILNLPALMPFGRMAVSSTLMVIGSTASLGIMWIDADIDPWTTILPLVPLTAALLFLFFGPLWPIHLALKKAKAIELDKVQKQINEARSDQSAIAGLAPLLTFRRELTSIHVWPLDVGIMTRFSLYVFIVPLTWIGAALIENVVDLFVAN